MFKLSRKNSRISLTAPALGAALVSAALVTSAFLTTSPAYAEPGPGSYGLGLIVGEPTGFSGAYILDQDHVIDGALAYSFFGTSDLQIHSDFLWRNNKFYQDQAPEVDFYYGAGLRLKFESPAEFGLRIPGGATYQFGTDPIQFFGEIAPILDVAPGIDVNIDIAIGARYFF